MVMFSVSLLVWLHNDGFPLDFLLRHCVAGGGLWSKRVAGLRGKRRGGHGAYFPSKNGENLLAFYLNESV